MFLDQLSIADKINLFNALGAWVAAIGTISAVIVALYLARRDKMIRVRLSAGHRLTGHGYDIRTYSDCCSIRVVNLSSRKVTITGIGWRTGFFKKKIFEQVLSTPSYPSPLPITLADGDEATWHIPFVSTDQFPNWIDTFPRNVLGENPHYVSKSLKVFVYTSIGKPIIASVEKPLRDKLIAAALKI